MDISNERYFDSDYPEVEDEFDEFIREEIVDAFSDITVPDGVKAAIVENILRQEQRVQLSSFLLRS